MSDSSLSTPRSGAVSPQHCSGTRHLTTPSVLTAAGRLRPISTAAAVSRAVFHQRREERLSLCVSRVDPLTCVTASVEAPVAAAIHTFDAPEEERTLEGRLNGIEAVDGMPPLTSPIFESAARRLSIDRFEQQLQSAATTTSGGVNDFDTPREQPQNGRGFFALPSARRPFEMCRFATQQSEEAVDGGVAAFDTPRQTEESSTATDDPQSWSRRTTESLRQGTSDRVVATAQGFEEDRSTPRGTCPAESEPAYSAVLSQAATLRKVPEQGCKPQDEIDQSAKDVPAVPPARLTPCSLPPPPPPSLPTFTSPLGNRRSIHSASSMPVPLMVVSAPMPSFAATTAFTPTTAIGSASHASLRAPPSVSAAGGSFSGRAVSDHNMMDDGANSADGDGPLRRMHSDSEGFYRQLGGGAAVASTRSARSAASLDVPRARAETVPPEDYQSRGKTEVEGPSPAAPPNDCPAGAGSELLPSSPPPVPPPTQQRAIATLLRCDGNKARFTVGGFDRITQLLRGNEVGNANPVPVMPPSRLGDTAPPPLRGATVPREGSQDHLPAPDVRGSTYMSGCGSSFMYSANGEVFSQTAPTNPTERFASRFADPGFHEPPTGTSSPMFNTISTPRKRTERNVPEVLTCAANTSDHGDSRRPQGRNTCLDDINKIWDMALCGDDPALDKEIDWTNPWVFETRFFSGQFRIERMENAFVAFASKRRSLATIFTMGILWAGHVVLAATTIPWVPAVVVFPLLLLALLITHIVIQTAVRAVAASEAVSGPESKRLTSRGRTASVVASTDEEPPASYVNARTTAPWRLCRCLTKAKWARRLLTRDEGMFLPRLLERLLVVFFTVSSIGFVVCHAVREWLSVMSLSDADKVERHVGLVGGTTVFSTAVQFGASVDALYFAGILAPLVLLRYSPRTAILLPAVSIATIVAVIASRVLLRDAAQPKNPVQEILLDRFRSTASIAVSTGTYALLLVLFAVVKWMMEQHVRKEFVQRTRAKVHLQHALVKVGAPIASGPFTAALRRIQDARTASVAMVRIRHVDALLSSIDAMDGFSASRAVRQHMQAAQQLSARIGRWAEDNAPGIEVVRAWGDTFCAVSNLSFDCEGHVVDCARFALKAIELVREIYCGPDVQHSYRAIAAVGSVVRGPLGVVAVEDPSPQHCVSGEAAETALALLDAADDGEVLTTVATVKRQHHPRAKLVTGAVGEERCHALRDACAPFGVEEVLQILRISGTPPENIRNAAHLPVTTMEDEEMTLFGLDDTMGDYDNASTDGRLMDPELLSDTSHCPFRSNEECDPDTDSEAGAKKATDAIVEAYANTRSGRALRRRAAHRERKADAVNACIDDALSSTVNSSSSPSDFSAYSGGSTGNGDFSGGGSSSASAMVKIFGDLIAPYHHTHTDSSKASSTWVRFLIERNFTCDLLEQLFSTTITRVNTSLVALGLLSIATVLVFAILTMLFMDLRGATVSSEKAASYISGDNAVSAVTPDIFAAFMAVSRQPQPYDLILRAASDVSEEVLSASMARIILKSATAATPFLWSTDAAFVNVRDLLEATRVGNVSAVLASLPQFSSGRHGIAPPRGSSWRIPVVLASDEVAARVGWAVIVVGIVLTSFAAVALFLRKPAPLEDSISTPGATRAAATTREEDVFGQRVLTRGDTHDERGGADFMGSDGTSRGSCLWLQRRFSGAFVAVAYLLSASVAFFALALTRPHIVGNNTGFMCVSAMTTVVFLPIRRMAATLQLMLMFVVFLWSESVYGGSVEVSTVVAVLLVGICAWFAREQRRLDHREMLVQLCASRMAAHRSLEGSGSAGGGGGAGHAQALPAVLRERMEQEQARARHHPANPLHRGAVIAVAPNADPKKTAKGAHAAPNNGLQCFVERRTVTVAVRFSYTPDANPSTFVHAVKVVRWAISAANRIANSAICDESRDPLAAATSIDTMRDFRASQSTIRGPLDLWAVNNGELIVGAALDSAVEGDGDQIAETDAAEAQARAAVCVFLTLMRDYVEAASSFRQEHLQLAAEALASDAALSEDAFGSIMGPAAGGDLTPRNSVLSGHSQRSLQARLWRIVTDYDPTVVERIVPMAPPGSGNSLLKRHSTLGSGHGDSGGGLCPGRLRAVMSSSNHSSGPRNRFAACDDTTSQGTQGTPGTQALDTASFATVESRYDPDAVLIPVFYGWRQGPPAPPASLQLPHYLLPGGTTVSATNFIRIDGIRGGQYAESQHSSSGHGRSSMTDGPTLGAGGAPIATNCFMHVAVGPALLSMFYSSGHASPLWVLSQADVADRTPLSDRCYVSWTHAAPTFFAPPQQSSPLGRRDSFSPPPLRASLSSSSLPAMLTDRRNRPLVMPEILPHAVLSEDGDPPSRQTSFRLRSANSSIAASMSATLTIPRLRNGALGTLGAEHLPAAVLAVSRRLLQQMDALEAPPIPLIPDRHSANGSSSSANGISTPVQQLRLRRFHDIWENIQHTATGGLVNADAHW